MDIEKRKEVEKEPVELRNRNDSGEIGEDDGLIE